jgi:steroid 5-alpha reductase family enzyme
MSNLDALRGMRRRPHLDTLIDSPSHAAVSLGLALLCSAVGFYRLVYFISLGYALAIGALATFTVASTRRLLGPLALVQHLLLGVWAVRLGTYLVRRELQPSYRTRASEQMLPPGPAWRSVAIWAAVSLLYVLMFSPADFAARTRTPGKLPLRCLGVLTMLGGLMLEGIADEQKARAKRAQPDRYCDTGLYRVVRCPNYLGEILVWLGNWLGGMPAFGHDLRRWSAATTGLLTIVLIMVGSTRRLELSQDARYGERADYQAYARRVPILFPGVPLYSLRSWRLRLG